MYVWHHGSFCDYNFKKTGLKKTLLDTILKQYIFG